MILLESARVWQTIRSVSKHAKKRMAAVAYFSNSNLINFGEGDTVIVDASNAAIASGQTSAIALEVLLKRKVAVYSLPGLHAKVFLFDGVTVVGSNNVSSSSMNHLVEAAIVTDLPQIASMTRLFIEKLIQNSAAVDPAFVRRIKKIEVKRIFNPTSNRRKKISLNRPQTWILGVETLAEDAFPEERRATNEGEKIAKRKLTRRSSEVNWIRYTPALKFPKAINEGDMVIEIESGKGFKGKVLVYPLCTVLHKKPTDKWVRIYIEEPVHIEHRALSLAKFHNVVKRAGYKLRIGRRMGRKIPENVSEAIAALWPSKS